MSFDWKAAVSKVAPWLGAALGGPLGGAAGKLIASALGGDPTKATPDDLAKLVRDVTPEQLLALKQADQAFQLQLKQMDITERKDLEALAAQDRDSARKREMVVRDATPRILAYAVVAVWGLINGFLLWAALHGKSLPVDMNAILMRVLGTLDAALTLALSYYFGSSASSHSKDELLYRSAPADQEAR